MSYRWRAVSLVSAYLLVTLIPLIGVPVVLPAISKEFGTSIAATSWVALAYSLAMAGAFMPAAHIGDVLGHKRVALLGAYAELAIMVVIVAMPSLALIIALRFVQGIAHSMSVPNYFAFAVSGFPSEERGKVIGVIVGVTSGGMLAVPLGVGLVTDALSWQWVFVIGAALLLVVTLLTQWMLALPQAAEGRRHSLKEFDIPGAVLLMLAVAPFVIGIQMVRGTGGLLPWGLIGVAAVLIGVFVRFEWSQEYAALPVKMFKRAAFAVPNVLNVLFEFSHGVAVYLVPVFFIQGLGWSATYAGVVVVTMHLARPIAAVVGGFLTSRLGPQPVMYMGQGLMLTALLGLGVAGPSGTLPGLVPYLLLFGFAHNLFTIGNQQHMFDVVPSEQLGLAPGVLGLGRHLSQGLGVGIAAGIFSSMLLDAPVDANNAAAAFRAVLLTTASFFTVGALAAALLPAGWGVLRAKGTQTKERIGPPPTV